MAQGNESRFSDTANYFVPTASAAGGSILQSTVLVSPVGGTGRINTYVSGTGVSGQLELGPSLGNFKTLTIYDNGSPVNGAGLNIASTEPSAGNSALNIVGPGTGTQANAAYIRINTSTGAESLTLAANTVVNNNIVLTPATTTVNTSLTTGQGDDIIMGGVLRTYNNVSNQAAMVPCPAALGGAVAAFNFPVGLIPGLYAVLLTEGNLGGLEASFTSALMYYSGARWTSGGTFNNPATGTGANIINSYGLRIIPGSPTQMAFLNGTAGVIEAGDCNIVFRLLLAGISGEQLYPFVT